jgi:hypothetical protein
VRPAFDRRTAFAPASTHPFAAATAVIGIRFALIFVLGVEVDLDGIGGKNERGVTAVTYDI